MPTAAPTLADLIETVEGSGEQELDRLAVAIEISRALSDVGDALIDHFVDAARNAGISWAQIGGILGVTKQAAQQRFVPKLDQSLSRWTDRSKAVLHAAQEHARRMHHAYIGTEHVLLALFDDPQALSTKVLTSFGVTQQVVTERVTEMIGAGPDEPKGDIVFTPRAAKGLELALREALKLGHNYVGTEHVLLGMIDLRQGVAYDILEDLGVTKAEVVKRVVAALGVQGAS